MLFQGYVHEAYHTATSFFCESVCFQVFICYRRKTEKKTFNTLYWKHLNTCNSRVIVTYVCWWSCSIWFAALRCWPPCPVGTNRKSQIILNAVIISPASLPGSLPAPPAVWRGSWSWGRSGSRLARSETQTGTFSVCIWFFSTRLYCQVFHCLTSVGSSAITSSSSSLTWKEESKHKHFT